MNRFHQFKNKIVFITFSILLICISSMIMPFDFLKSIETADNPQNCPYYITLQTILANYPLLASDKANLGFIQQRMMQFENDVNAANASNIILKYKQDYYRELAGAGLTSIKLAASDQVIKAAKNTYRTIDKYYLDDRLYCINPLYDWTKSNTHRILLYNLGSLYEQIPNRYMRIMSVIPMGPQLGVFSGFFVNNQTTILSAQFMTGMPLLTALYIMPNYDFARVGSYAGLVPWSYFDITYLYNPFTRKLLNISGMDIFTVDKQDLPAKKVPHVIPIKTTMPKMFDKVPPLKNKIRPKSLMGKGYQSYINTDSYGMAYLANNINYVDPRNIKEHEAVIKNFFAHADEPDTIQFRQATSALYYLLMSLHEKRDILLEDIPKMTAKDSRPAGNVTIQGIVGERALFNTNCARKDCRFVLNITMAPGWRAFVNGKPADILRANLTFMSIPVPEGKATVWFIYSSLPNLISYLISMVSLIMIFVISRVSKSAN